MYINIAGKGDNMKISRKCQFLIGNVYLYNGKIIDITVKPCQFLIGNVYQLVLSVSNYDTTIMSI